MKINEKILKYADDRMTDLERKKFENELQADPALMKQWETYKKNINDINFAKNIEIDREYFEKILPTFYRKNISSKQSFNHKFAFGFATVIVAVLMFLLLKPADIEEIKLEQNNAENVEYFNDYFGIGDSLYISGRYNDEADSLVYDQIAEELGLNLESNYRTTINEYDFNYYEDYLSDNEADLIYAEIIEMTFFNGDN